MTPETTAVVLFDGECNLCDKSVRFIFAHDPAGYFRFAPLQSDLGRALAEKYGHAATLAGEAPSSVILIEGGALYDRSTAALRIARRLSGPVRFLGGLLWVPAPLRDLGYRLIARVRYRIWGRHDGCTLPPPGLRERFLTGA